MTEGRKKGLLLGQDGGRPRSVEVDDLPFAIPAVPDAGLLRLGRAGDAARIQVLRDADIGDAGRLVAHQVDMGVQDGGVHGLAVPRPHWRWDGRGQRRCNWGPPASLPSLPHLPATLSAEAPLLASLPQEGLCDRAQLGVKTELLDG